MVAKGSIPLVAHKCLKGLSALRAFFGAVS